MVLGHLARIPGNRIDGDGVIELVIGASSYDSGAGIINLGRMHAVSIQNNLTVGTDHGQFYPIPDNAMNVGNPAVGAAVSGRAR